MNYTVSPIKSRLLPFILLLLVTPCFSHLMGSDEEVFTGLDIVDQYLSAQEVDSEVVLLEMKIKPAEEETKSYTFLALYKKLPEGGKGYLMRILKPEDVANVTLLTKEDVNRHARQYLYLPAIGKAKRLKRDSQRNPFLGSDFSYEDLLREIPASQTYSRLADHDIDGSECFVVKAVENYQKTRNGYHHRVLYIAKESNHLLKVDFYRTETEKEKTLTAGNYNSPQLKGATIRPHTALMKNAKTGSTTMFTVSESYINVSVDDQLFSPRRVESWSNEEISAFLAGLAKAE